MQAPSSETPDTSAGRAELVLFHDGCLDEVDLATLAPTATLKKWTPRVNNFSPGIQTDRPTVFAGKVTADIYPIITACPFDALVEVTDAQDIRTLSQVLKDVAKHGTIVLNLSSKTAYGLKNAERFCELLNHQAEFAEPKRGELTIVLHEGIANAILHGNLEIQSAERHGAFGSLEKQFAETEARLDLSKYGRRRIQITAANSIDELKLEIRNEGPGYQGEAIHHKPSGSPRRGMELIQAMTDRHEIDKDGRRLTLFFKQRPDKSVTMKTPTVDVPTTESPVELEFTECPVLVVDDDEMICEFIKMNLLVGGYKNIDISMDGQDALEKVKTFNPDLMILDMSMPVLDGFGVLKEIRGNPASADLPVLVTTALDSHEDRNNVLRHGASNLISKPIDADILLQRSRELLERRLLLRELTRYRTRLEHELSAAREMQSQIVTSQSDAASIASKYDCRIESHYRSSSELGGDFWGMRAIDDNRFMLFTADFSGHGVAASLNTFRLDAIIKEMDVPSASPGAFLENVNASLYSLLEPGQFATMLCAIVDPGDNRLVYSGAAAPEPIIGNIHSGDIRLEDGSGMLLGVRDGSTYEDREIPFPKGSFLFLFSDALFESPTLDGPALEVEGVLELARGAISTRPEQPLDYLLERFDREVEQPLNDDLTAVWLSH